MNFKLGTQDAEKVLSFIARKYPGYIEAVRGLAGRMPFGATLEFFAAKPEYSRKQEKKLHALLHYWIENSELQCDVEALKHHQCGKEFGMFEMTLPEGQPVEAPVRTTTKVWDHDLKKYVADHLSKQGYSALIDRVIRTANDMGITFPEDMLELDAERETSNA